MRRLIFSLAVVNLSLCALAQPPSPTKGDGTAIHNAKSILASSFDSRLPRVSLEYFLEYETDGAPAKWIVTECKEHAVKRSSSTCVQADFDLNNGAALTILIRLDGPQNQKFQYPSVVSLSVTELDGNVRQIRSLADLPMELHRWPSGRSPADLAPPGRPA